MEKQINEEHEQLGFAGRFGPGLPRVSDGSLLFLLHMIAKMKPDEQGSRLAIVFNGSPLFTGGAGRNYLIQHSAGSGKSKTIAWLAYQLASLHDAADRRVFHSVVVVTDRRVLDQQLQETIYQIEHKEGVVQKIDKHSGQLAEALERGANVIITTLQKVEESAIQLEKGAEGQLSGATEAGIRRDKEERAHLSEIIEVLNQLLGTTSRPPTSSSSTRSRKKWCRTRRSPGRPEPIPGRISGTAFAIASYRPPSTAWDKTRKFSVG